VYGASCCVALLLPGLVCRAAPEERRVGLGDQPVKQGAEFGACRTERTLQRLPYGVVASAYAAWHRSTVELLAQRCWYGVQDAVRAVEWNGFRALPERIDGDALFDRSHSAMTSDDAYPCEPP
jgi:hypothetical protein